MTIKSVTQSVSMLAVLGLLPGTLTAKDNHEQLAMEKEGVQLIRQLEEVGRDVRYEAGRLTSISGSPQYTKWTHVHRLEQIKSLVNDGLRPALTRLTVIQPMLPEWKRQSIDKMLEAAQMLAADTNAAIWTKNDSGAMPLAMNAEYKTLLGKIYEHSELLVKTSDAAGTYAAARLKAHEAGIKVPKQ